MTRCHKPVKPDRIVCVGDDPYTAVFGRSMYWARGWVGKSVGVRMLYYWLDVK